MDKRQETTNENITDRLSTSIRSKRCIVQNFRLICLDVDIDDSFQNSMNSNSHLRHLIKTVDTFTDADECIDFLTDIKDEKIFLIVSDTLGQNVVPFIHDAPQLDSIYVFSSDNSYNEQWANEWWKVKDVFTQTGCIYNSLQQATKQCDHNMVSMSFIAAGELLNPNLDQLDPSFMYTQLLKETLLDIRESNSKSIEEFTDYCRTQYIGDPVELEKIEKFKREYNLHTPIWWYTCESFIYSMLNRSLRTLEVDIILKVGFFMHDLLQHIEQLYLEQSNDHQTQVFTVYRGQGLSKIDFGKLMQSKGGLMSFNNFLSTSIDREASLAFAESNGGDPNMIGILFEIAIDRSISSTPFAVLGNVSNFQSEEEILFSMHSVFRIGDIQQMEQVWQVKLTLTNDKDEDLNGLTNRLREELYTSTKGWFRLGSLLIKLGQFDKAEQLYELLLDQTPEGDDKIDCYSQLAQVNYSKYDYQQALNLKVQAVQFMREKIMKMLEGVPSETIERLIPKNVFDILEATATVGSDLNNYPKIRACGEQLGVSIGLPLISAGDYLNAISYYKKELEHLQSSLPGNHPNLAAPYSGIATAYLGMQNYSEALLNYKKAFEIREKSLPPFHSDLAASYNNIGLVYFEMDDYPQALSYCEKALEIWQKSLPPDHLDLAIAYNNIGLIYESMDDASKSLLFYEKTIEIRQKSLPPDDTDLESCINDTVQMKLDFI